MPNTEYEKFSVSINVQKTKTQTKHIFTLSLQVAECINGENTFIHLKNGSASVQRTKEVGVFSLNNKATF